MKAADLPADKSADGAEDFLSSSELFSQTADGEKSEKRMVSSILILVSAARRDGGFGHRGKESDMASWKDVNNGGKTLWREETAFIGHLWL